MNIHNNPALITKKEMIDEKIQLLKDFGLFSNKIKKERRAVISILATCNSEIQMEQKLHNVLHGKETLDDLIGRHQMLFTRHN